jgi:hypothetical protein
MTAEQGGNGLGKLIAIGLGLFVGAKLIEGATGRSIWDVLAEYAAHEAARKQAQEEEARRRRYLEALVSQPPLPVLGEPLSLKPILSLPVPAATPPPKPQVKMPAPALEPDAAWRQKIVHPSVVLVLGKRGSGKSALGYRLLELFRYTATPPCRRGPHLGPQPVAGVDRHRAQPG